MEIDQDLPHMQGEEAPIDPSTHPTEPAPASAAASSDASGSSVEMEKRKISAEAETMMMKEVVYDRDRGQQGYDAVVERAGGDQPLSLSPSTTPEANTKSAPDIVVTYGDTGTTVEMEAGNTVTSSSHIAATITHAEGAETAASARGRGRGRGRVRGRKSINSDATSEVRQRRVTRNSVMEQTKAEVASLALVPAATTQGDAADGENGGMDVEESAIDGGTQGTILQDFAQPVGETSALDDVQRESNTASLVPPAKPKPGRKKAKTKKGKTDDNDGAETVAVSELEDHEDADLASDKGRVKSKTNGKAKGKAAKKNSAAADKHKRGV